MPTITIQATYKGEKPLGMPRARIVDTLILTAALETISARSLGLKTITTEPLLTSREIDYEFYGSTHSPGSPDNYVAVDIRFIGTPGAPVRATGSHYAALHVGGVG